MGLMVTVMLAKQPLRNGSSSPYTPCPARKQTDEAPKRWRHKFTHKTKKAPFIVATQEANKLP